MKENIFKIFITAVIIVFVILFFSIKANAKDPQELVNARNQLEEYYKNKEISYQEYFKMKSKIIELLLKEHYRVKEYYDEYGRLYVLDDFDCNFVRWGRLKQAVEPLGFKAGAGGGSVQVDEKIYCFPCVKHATTPMPKWQKTKMYYKPVLDIIDDYSYGHTFEFCEIK